MITSISTVWFQREKGGPKEKGLALNEDGVIVDGDMKIVPKVWNCGETVGIAIHGLEIGGEVAKKGE